MANLVIVSTTNSIEVIFNELSSSTGTARGIWNKKSIVSVELDSSSEFVYIKTTDGTDWKVSFESNDQTPMIIDTIDTVAPSSNQELYDKLKVLIQ